MRLETVTITGADDSIPPGVLANLQAAHPFVEWGVLLSVKHQGLKPRFPSAGWVEGLLGLKRGAHPDLQLAAHVCGGWARGYANGHDMLGLRDGANLAGAFGRVQLNLGDAALADLVRDPMPFLDLANRCGLVGWILQYPRGAAARDVLMAHGFKAQVLFDASGGAGVVPAEWPRAGTLLHVGYAGGLGPTNLKDQLPRIADAAGEHARVWLDMESGVRSADDTCFNVPSVRRVLEFLAPHVVKSAR